MFEIIKKWDLIAKYIWNRPKKPKKFKVSHYWHNKACKKTLLKIKQELYPPPADKFPEKNVENTFKESKIDTLYKSDMNNITKYWKSYSYKTDVKYSNPNFLVVGKRIGNVIIN